MYNNNKLENIFLLKNDRNFKKNIFEYYILLITIMYKLQNFISVCNIILCKNSPAIDVVNSCFFYRPLFK